MGSIFSTHYININKLKSIFSNYKFEWDRFTVRLICGLNNTNYEKAIIVASHVAAYYLVLLASILYYYIHLLVFFGGTFNFIFLIF